MPRKGYKQTAEHIRSISKKNLKWPIVDGKKTCSRCKEIKPLSEFYKRGKSLTSCYCKECEKEADRLLTAKCKAGKRCLACDSPIYGKYSVCGSCRAKRNSKKHEMKKRAIEYMGGQCFLCGLKTDIIAVYDFHHNDNKEYESATLWSKKWEIVEKEIQKCRLVCANCHRILHAEEDLKNLELSNT